MATAIYGKDGTAKTWKASGGDYTITLTSLGNGAGRIGAQADLGSGARPTRYTLSVEVKAASAATDGNPVNVYIVESDGVNQASALGTSDAAISDEDRLRNARLIGAVYADAEGSNIYKGLFTFETFARYISPVVWNALGVALSGTAGDHDLNLTPSFDEAQ